MQAISVKFERKFLNDMEAIMKKHRYSTKTEFIREAVRDKIIDIEKEEALIRLKKAYGASKKRTTDSQLKKAKEEAFEELERELR